MYIIVVDGALRDGNPGQAHALFTIYEEAQLIEQDCYTFPGHMDLLTAQYRSLAYALDGLLLRLNCPIGASIYQFNSLDEELEVWTSHADFNLEMVQRESHEVENDVMHSYIVSQLQKFGMFRVLFKNRREVNRRVGYKREVSHA